MGAIATCTSKSLSNLLGINDHPMIAKEQYLVNWGLTFTVFKEISAIKELWDDQVPDEILRQSDYLRTLELTNPRHLTNLYVVVKNDQQSVVGVVLLQSIVLDFGSSFRYEKYTTDRSPWSRLWQKVRQAAVSWIKFRLMVVGNLYLTGQYGIYLSQYSSDEKFHIVQDLLKVLKREFCGSGLRFSGILYKDYFEHEALTKYKELGLEPFNIDPNMILPLRSSWQTFDDYLLDMKSKYRVRLKNAIKKFKGIERRVLTLEEVIAYNEDIYRLYDSILEGSGFVLAKGDNTYFKTLKRQLGEKYHVIGYFLEGRLVAFYTWMLEGDKIDSHFIGLDGELNNKYQLYLNILLDLVRDGINQNATSIYYFRTALEIKSSIGAEPHDMTCYFRHTNGIINSIIPVAFQYFIPQQLWDQRHPFKESAED